MTEIDLNKSVAKIELPTFTFNKIKYKVRALSRTDAKKQDEQDDLEQQFRDADDVDKLAGVICEMLDTLVEPVVKTGKGGKPLGKLLLAEWNADRLTYEDLVAIRYQILDAKDSALRPT